MTERKQAGMQAEIDTILASHSFHGHVTSPVGAASTFYLRQPVATHYTRMKCVQHLNGPIHFAVD